MLTQLLVIQKINQDASLDLFRTDYGRPVQWSFDDSRKKEERDKEIFPFAILDQSKVIHAQNSPDAKCYIRENQIIYTEDFGVVGGTVIGVLFPKNYIPDIIKFNEKPAMPVGAAGILTSTSPGQFEVKYNHAQKQCTIIFHLFSGTLFGLKCIAKQVLDAEFPKGTDIIRDEVYDISLSREFFNVDVITTEDLKLINEVMNQADLAEIQQTLNELLTAVKAGDKEQGKSLLNKAGTLLLNGTSAASSLVTIVDSYKTGNEAQQFLSRIIEYINL